MIRVTPAQFAKVLAKVGPNLERAVEAGFREAAMLLSGSLVQGAIAGTSPQPVDMGQYKASWSATDVKGGAVVGNSSKQAVWLERGRMPGPVPYAPILQWVKRKGIARGDEENAAAAIQHSIALRGYRPRWVLRRAIEALRPRLPGIIASHVKKAAES